MESKYKRIILKISGESLAGDDHFGIKDEMLHSVASDVEELLAMGVQIGIVVGGGNFWRGRTSDKMDRASADYMGMLATTINALALQDAFEQHDIPVRVLTSLEMRAIAEPYARKRALSLLDRGIVVIFACGTGAPFVSTDTCASLRAAEIKADVILMGKKIDAVYDSDPAVNPNAKKYTRLTHQEVLEKNLQVMDATAASMCRDNGIKIHCFGMSEPKGIIRACKGEEIGTIIE